MKTKNFKIGSAGVLLLALTVGGCAAVKPNTTKSSEEIAASGPTVIDARTSPGTYQLNLDLDPVQKAEVFADVKDFRNRITSVTLRFIHVPLEVPLKRVAGTTWRAELTPEQLRTLAVSGHVMKYDAEVIAKNDKGQPAVSKNPLSIAIKAPDVAQLTG